MLHIKYISLFEYYPALSFVPHESQSTPPPPPQPMDSHRYRFCVPLCYCDFVNGLFLIKFNEIDDKAWLRFDAVCFHWLNLIYYFVLFYFVSFFSSYSAVLLKLSILHTDLHENKRSDFYKCKYHRHATKQKQKKNIKMVSWAIADSRNNPIEFFVCFFLFRKND